MAPEALTQQLANVTSPTIRKRILKLPSEIACIRESICYIAYDPQEDTETRRAPDQGLIGMGYIAYDPQEDTETLSEHGRVISVSESYIAYDPQEDTETHRGCLP